MGRPLGAIAVALAAAVSLAGPSQATSSRPAQAWPSSNGAPNITIHSAKSSARAYTPAVTSQQSGHEQDSPSTQHASGTTAASRDSLAAVFPLVAIFAALAIEIGLVAWLWILTDGLNTVGRIGDIEPELRVLFNDPALRPYPTVVECLGELARQARANDRNHDRHRASILRIEAELADLRAVLAQARPTQSDLLLTQRRPAEPETARQPPPLPPPARRPSLAVVEDSYREAVQSNSRSRLRDFTAQSGAVAVTVPPDGAAPRLDPAASSPYLQAIEVDGGMIALVPGDDIVIGFATTYCTKRAMPEELAAAFDFQVDGARSLSLIRASLWRLDASGGLRLEQKGLLGGLAD